MLHAPDLSPDAPEIHPVILYGDLYAEDPRAPQTQFVLDRQIAFLEALATSGSVRSAARRARVSHQTCYRARRNSAAFGRAWDAALVVARAAAEEKLADCAINGVREEVWYHGELVGYRIRQSDRLILAHLARLDRMRTDERVEALAEDFDAMLCRMRMGEPIEPIAPDAGTAPAEAEILPPGQCNRRSMSPAMSRSSKVVSQTATSVRAEPVSHGDSCASEAPSCTFHDGAAEDAAGDPADQLRFRQAQGERGREGRGCAPAPVPPCPDCGGACEGPEEALTSADCQWLGNRLDRMEAARPERALSPAQRPGGDPDGAVEWAQLLAFEAGEAEWWLVGMAPEDKAGDDAGDGGAEED